MDNRAVVLLSGGIDSAVTLAIAQQEGYECNCLLFDCGQLRQALKVARLLVRDAHVQKYRITPLYLPGKEADLTYNRPGRNLIFLSVAFAWAIKLGAENIFIGCNQNDLKDYPDCRSAFLNSFEGTASLAIGEPKALMIRVPLINDSKRTVIKRGVKLGIDFSKTFSCYCPVEGLHCGTCHSCMERKTGFAEAGVEDPTIYAKLKEKP